MSVQFDRLKTYLLLLVALVVRYRQNQSGGAALVESLNAQLAAQSAVVERLSSELADTQVQLTTALSNDAVDAQAIANSAAVIELTNSQIIELQNNLFASQAAVSEAQVAVEAARAETATAQAAVDAAQAELAANDQELAGLADLAQEAVEPATEPVIEG